MTPRRPGPEIDLAAAFELIDFLVHAGVNGIALMGSTGELPHFTLEERGRFVALAVKRSRVPILAAVGHSTFDGALALGREAADAGAAGLLLMPPYFFRYGAADIHEFYLRYAEQLKDAAPLYLYNIPAFASGIPVATSIELLSKGLFAGIKDSSASWDDFLALKAARERCPFSLLCGHDVIFARMRAGGADGIVSGIASAVPELLVGLDRAIRAGDSSVSERLDARVQEFLAWIDVFPAPLAIRHAAALRGLRTGPPASPPAPETDKKLGEFSEWFRGWLPEVQKEARDVSVP